MKTLADSLGPHIKSAQAQTATIARLAELLAPPRAQLQAADAHRFGPERRVYQVNALVVGYKVEADSDFHIVLADPEKPDITLIAEIPAGHCTPAAQVQFFDGLQKAFGSIFGRPTASFHRLKEPVAATFTGVGFYDFLHGQTGVAKNGFELHPVLGFSVGPREVGLAGTSTAGAR